MTGIRKPQKAQPPVHGRFHSPKNVFIAGTAAQVPGKEFSQFLIRIFLTAFQNLHRRQNKAGRTKSALDRRFVHKCLLNIAQFTVGAQQPLQRPDVLSLCPDRQINAGIERLAVNENGAGSALPYLAAFFDRSHAVVFPQHIRQAGSYIYGPLRVFSIQIKMDCLILDHMILHYKTPPASFTDSKKARLALSTAMCIRKSLAARQESLGLISAFTACAKVSASCKLTG